MPRLVPVSGSQIEWLRANHAKHTQNELADFIGCCVDTLKRILTRHGIVNFPGAKYQPPADVKMWNRPCLDCRDTTLRPCNWYYCRPCRLRRGYDNED